MLFGILGFMLFCCNIKINAQPNNPNISLNIKSGENIVFNFNTLNELKNGIVNAGHDTYIRVGCANNWDLSFRTNDSEFSGTNNPTNVMPLNNIGVKIVSTGNNLDDGSNIVNNAKFNALALSNSDVILLTKGILKNAGFGIKNSFVFRWEAGTKSGNMNNTSVFDQYIPADSYTTTIVITLSVQ